MNLEETAEIYNNVYRLVDSVVGGREKSPDAGFSSFAAIDYCEKENKKVIALIIAGDWLVKATYKEVDPEKDTLGFRSPYIRMMYPVKGGVQERYRFLDWDGSREKLTELIMSECEEKDVILGSIPKNAPLKSALAQFFGMYKSHQFMKEWFENEQAEGGKK